MFDSCLSEFGCRRRQGKIQRPVKMLYYGANLVQPKRAWQAWRRRQVNIRQVDDPELIAIDAAFK